MKITEKTKISEALAMSRHVAAVLKRYGLECVGCRGAAQDSVGRAAVNYGLDLDALLEDLNKALDE